MPAGSGRERVYVGLVREEDQGELGVPVSLSAHPGSWARDSTSLKAASSPEVWLERPKRFSTVEMELLR